MSGTPASGDYRHFLARRPSAAEARSLLDALKSAQLPAVPDASAPSLPADPFGMTDDAGIALAEMYRSMLAAGIPLASTEKILGHMLASLPPGGA